MKINYNNVKEREEDELIHFIGFLPFQFYKFIGLLERNNYLKSIGAYDDI